MMRLTLVLVLALGTEAAAQGVLVERLSWDEARPLLTAEAVVLVAVGAQSKEHGRHLPLNNDWLMAEYLKGRVVAAVPVVAYPTINYHFYPAFRPFPGSTTLEQNTARDMVADVIRSVALHGPRKFYVLNTGVSTIAPLKATQALLRLEGIEMRFTDILAVAGDVEKRLSKQQEGTHADETETSAMLYIAPDVVRMPRAVRDYRRLRDQWPHVGGSGEHAATGVYGDPTLATREKGEAIVEAMVKGILQEVEALRRASPPAP
ncbi:MAG: creatininase family protein [Acidobacteria bacterium]|nr:creatininase family protein [Acidobacteriota bacterium]